MRGQNLVALSFIVLLVAGCQTPTATFNEILSTPLAPPPSTPIIWKPDPACLRDTGKWGATRQDIAQLCPTKTNKDFIALALSGGGAKASAFAGESMFYLQALGILPNASMISSVSGGSFASAYYALSCDPGDLPCQKEIHDGLRRPLWRYSDSMNVLQSGFAPMLYDAVVNFVVPGKKTPVQPKTFADFIDRSYFHMKGVPDGQFRFADLNPHRPSLVLNSTLLSDSRPIADTTKNQGYLRRRTADEYFHFAFTDYYFNAIGSDLSKFPLGYGTAASGAFPALIGYPALRNYRFCAGQTDVDKCLRDEKNLLTLTDGGANDNQGLIEIFAAMAEIAGDQARSDLSAANSLGHDRLELMGTGDRALILVINSSITEATGVDSPRQTDFLLGTINRASAAVDAYSAVGYNLRKRLYSVDGAALCQAKNRAFISKYIADNNIKPDEVLAKITEAVACHPGADGISLTHKEVGLVTLNRYPAGGAEADFVKRADLPADDELGRELVEPAKIQSAVFNWIKQATNRTGLALSHMHPQCLFEQSKLVEKGLLSLAQISPANAICLRHAARWATALRAEELCEEANSLNDESKIRCSAHHLKPLTQEWLDNFNSLTKQECGFSDDSEDEKAGILASLEHNPTFAEELPSEWKTAGRDPNSVHFTQPLEVVCNLDNTSSDSARVAAAMSTPVQ